MELVVLLILSTPIPWLIAAMALLAWFRFGRRTGRKRAKASRRVRVGLCTSAAAGAAFQFLSLAYRPNQAFVVKAQIRQQEDADEDDDGGPDSPLRHLHRQLRRIRRGEEVKTLIWRLQ